MKFKLFSGALFLTAALAAGAQTPQPEPKIATASPKTTRSAKQTQATARKTPSPAVPAAAPVKTGKPAAAAPPPPQINQQPYVRPDAKTRFNRYLNSTVGPFALARSAASAGFSTWRNTPEEWGKKWDGFGKRFASNLGSRAISNTTTYAMDEAFKLDSRFYRSQNRKFGARLKNALVSPVTARNEEGKRVFGFPRIAGVYAGSVISRETWYPDRYDYKDGLRSGTKSLGMSVLYNLVREFVLK